MQTALEEAGVFEATEMRPRRDVEAWAVASAEDGAACSGVAVLGTKCWHRAVAVMPRTDTCSSIHIDICIDICIDIACIDFCIDFGIGICMGEWTCVWTRVWTCV